MTHDVCFKFCRTIPDMSFFGLTHGHDCYCMPFYKQLAGDSSKCDVACEGQEGSFCGGTKKSSIFEMHMCSSSSIELSATSGAAAQIVKKGQELSTKIAKLTVSMQQKVAHHQQAFGAVGDQAASFLMKATKESLGLLDQAATHVTQSTGPLLTELTKADAMMGFEFEQLSDATPAQNLISKITAQLTTAKDVIKKASFLYNSAIRGVGQSGFRKQYQPLLNFVDKEHANSPSTCAGTWYKNPILNASVDECATACEAQVNEPGCIGFSIYKGGFCYLFSKFTSVTYYSQCPPIAEQGTSDDVSTQCFAKLKDFDGVNLSPDSTGKCKFCLKKATKASKCFM